MGNYIKGKAGCSAIKTNRGDYARSGLLVFVFLIASSLLAAQKNDNTPADILRLKHTNDFAITGDGTAAEWDNAEWNLITQRPADTLRSAGWRVSAGQPNTNDPRYETRFKILYTDKGIYCLYKCEDSAITSTLKEDYANLFNEDVVEAFFRSDTTMPIYFEYELSPSNYELPILIWNSKGNTTGWKPWRYEGENKIIHAVKIHENNTGNSKLTWTAEFFIPYKLLTPTKMLPPPKGTRWRANFYRIDYDRKPIYFSWKLTLKNFHDFERFGIMEFD